jgi:hypothetical protein
LSQSGYNTRHYDPNPIVEIMSKADEKIRTWWKDLLSVFKRDWNLSDYRISVRIRTTSHLSETKRGDLDGIAPLERFS